MTVENVITLNCNTNVLLKNKHKFKYSLRIYKDIKIIFLLMTVELIRFTQNLILLRELSQIEEDNLFNVVFALDRLEQQEAKIDWSVVEKIDQF